MSGQRMPDWANVGSCPCKICTSIRNGDASLHAADQGLQRLYVVFVGEERYGYDHAIHGVFYGGYTLISRHLIWGDPLPRSHYESPREYRDRTTRPRERRLRGF